VHATRDPPRLGLLVLAVACATALTFGVVAGAQALWSHDRSVSTVMYAGGVSFAAHLQNKEESPVYSSAGEPVSVTLPGSVIGSVLDPSRTEPGPVIWRFHARGWADGIAGMEYAVAVTRQGSDGADGVDLTAGVAAPGTVLGSATLLVFPATGSGECAPLPTPSSDGSARNVHVFDRDPNGNYVSPVTGHVLQKPGGRRLPDGVTTQTWCVAIHSNVAADGAYANEVTARGTDANQVSHEARDSWHATLFRSVEAWPNRYANDVLAEATSAQGLAARAHDRWYVDLTPDPSQEPDVTIELDPAVTQPEPHHAAG
jgi:hypothetical protein